MAADVKLRDRREDGLELFADLYELTMARAYVELGFDQEAIFSLFVRRLPQRRNFLIACGIDTVLEDLADFRFAPESIEYLASLDGRFPDPFLRWLQDFRITADIRAVEEGEPVFANEPIMEVRAPIAEAQLIETLLLNRVSLQTMLASKAARVLAAADGRPVIDFGGRRAHGIDSAVTGARGMYIAGVVGTANVLAGHRFGVPVFGTVAHSFIDACGSEERAFREFARLYPNTTLLIDTYDTLAGAQRVIEMSKQLGDDFLVSGVRIDSGDLGAQSKAVRALFDEAGMPDMRIIVSGGLNEGTIASLLADGAPIDGFGAGTEMSVSGDAPSLDIVYKLVELGGEGRMKLSAGKRTPPGSKQVFRAVENGVATGDVIACADETLPGRPLLSDVMRAGQPVGDRSKDLDAIRERSAARRAELPEELRGLDAPPSPYSLRYSDKLEAREAALIEEIRAREAL